METCKLTNSNTNSNQKYQYSTLTSTNANVFDGSVRRHTLNTMENRTYIFGDEVSDRGSSKNDATEMTQLRPRGGGGHTQSYTTESSKTALSDDVVHLEREIQPNDTLQSFALLYGCTINDIKRANNLIKEQEFHALRRIKIPVKRHGLLTEPEEEMKRRPVAVTSLGGKTLPSALTTSLSDRSQSSQVLNTDVYINPNEELDFSESMENVDLLRSTSLSSTSDIVDRNDTNKLLKKMDKEIRKTVRKNDKLETERNETLHEVVSSLGSVGYRPLPIPGSRPTVDECNGADWGVKWWVLLLCFVIVLIAAIFIGVEYYLYHKRSFYNTNAVTNPGGPS
ncbi:unnamed protein product [Clavelina lepadiformis]|uniref:LysM domain-containing protein n=1 Tax=Clavelina lepadiformis TaxID=159417 RepID=A0ABP0FCV7_CLALP